MFLFKNIAGQFFGPLSLTLELLLIGLVLLFFTSKQKAGKILVLIGVIILVLCSYTPTADILINSLKKQYVPYSHVTELRKNEMPNLVVVLGAGSNPKPSAPVMSRIGYDGLTRLIEGIRIYRMIPEGKLLLSGGSPSNGTTGSSAEIMAQIAKDIGINEQDLILENQSRNTKDEAEIIQSMIGNKRFVLVTSEAHMPRSMALFKKQGMRPIPAPTRSLERKLYSRTPDPFFPSSINLQKAEMAFHEYLGIFWARLRGQI